MNSIFNSNVAENVPAVCPRGRIKKRPKKKYTKFTSNINNNNDNNTHVLFTTVCWNTSFAKARAGWQEQTFKNEKE